MTGKRDEREMSEENLKTLKEALKEAAYIPNDRIGVSERKVIMLDTVLALIEIYK